jgi:hypothetical protein
MKSTIKIVSLLSLVILFASNVYALKTQQFLPEGNLINGEVMQMGFSQEMQDLSIKFQEGVKKHGTWLQEYIQENPDGPLPYHVNFGITKGEYERYQKVSKEGAKLVKIGEIEIQLEHIKEGLIFHTENDAFPLNDVHINFKNDSVTTKYARLDIKSEIHQDDKSALTGRWKGLQWRYEKLEGNVGTSVKLAIGERTDHGDGIIYYDVTNLVGETPEQYHFVIIFPKK